MKEDYEDIINLTRPISNYKKMSIENRAAQFHPFKALTGHEEEIEKNSRYVEKKKELSETNYTKLNDMMIGLKKNLSKEIMIEITYFVKDSSKEGGKYITLKSVIKKINENYRFLELSNGQKIYFEDILEISFTE